MKTISTQAFKHTLKDIHKNTDSRKFCFVIGAGASRKSGIPTGGELAEKWFAEIKQRLDGSELGEWIRSQKINEADLAASYGDIYRKRFENDKTSGYEFLVKEMASATPSFGHIVLAQILSRAPGHCVLTTNFDSLIESSVYQFTDKTPLVCGHESLSGYARPSQTHPLIVKIHRDLLMAPKSDPDEINKLDIGWKEPLDHIFSTHIPVVIGYGGNDGSLMSYFETMNKPSNIFWCGRNEANISERIKKIIELHNGVFVKIDGFDELMHDLLWVFDEIKPIRDELNEITQRRIETATKQFEEIASPNKVVYTNYLLSDELSALEYSNIANQELNFEIRKEIYLKALDKYPDTGWLWWHFTHFMHFVKRDYNDLEKYYNKALSLNKEAGGLLGNYAVFLEDVKKDYSKAEEYYLMSVAFNPQDANLYCNYAGFLLDVKRDYANAEDYYLKALTLDPNHGNSNVNYANFLREVKRDYKNAEQYYLKALRHDPENPIKNANYAVFLQKIKTDDTKVEEYFLKALTYAPNDATINEAYAAFLNRSKKNYEKSEEYYLKALTINPNSFKTLGNYGIFLKEVKKDYVKAEEYTLKSLTIDPNYSISNGNYAQMLLEKGLLKEAESFLKLAFDDKLENELLIEYWFYRYAHYPEYLLEAEIRLEELLSKEIKSIGWDFEKNIEQAIKDGHPNPRKLKEIAKRITIE